MLSRIDGHHHGHHGRHDGPPRVRDAGHNAETSTATAAAYHEARTADLVFTTADGDTVTISASSTQDVAVATYDRRGQVSGTAVQASGDSSLSIQVEGTLDKEELQDIKKVLNVLRRAGQDGQIDQKEASQLLGRQDIDSLAGVTAQFSVTRSAVAFAATA